jgi:acyl dehydratase
MRYFEDLRVGEVRELGSHVITRDEIVAFARQFDPQPFHLDEALAEKSIYGGLIASGWHTASLCMRLVVDSFAGQVASMGSPGVDELRWLKPVRPGDTLSLKTECIALTPSRSKPDRGTARFRYTLTNQRGEQVLSMVGLGMIGRQPTGPATAS